MKKRSIIIILCLLLILSLTTTANAEETNAAPGIVIDETVFPDAAFRAWVLENLPHGFTASGEPYMTRQQIDSVKEIDCSGQEIVRMNGVGKFRMLETLNCSGNAIKTLNLTGLENLCTLDCSDNALETLILSEDYLLETLLCRNNTLESLNLQDNLSLREIDCSHNRLKSIAKVKNLNLRKLNCSHNELDNDGLNITLYENLEVLDCSFNHLTYLPVYYCGGLTELRCSDNLLTQLNLSENLLTYLDCSNNALSRLPIPSTIETLIFRNNRIGGRFDYEALVNLRYLDCSFNYITELWFVDDHVKYIDCSYNNLTHVSVGKYTEYLDCRYNQLTDLYLEDVQNLQTAKLDGQRTTIVYGFEETENGFEVQIGSLVSDSARIRRTDPYQRYDPETGIMTVPEKRDYLDYRYDTGNGLMLVRAYLPFDRTVTLEFYPDQVQERNGIEYVYYNGARQYPAVRVLDENGTDVDPIRYSISYQDNGAPGTARIRVSFYRGEQGHLQFEKTFKIYLKETTETKVENRSDGIRISWAPVEGAGGYVIYRRAWNLISDGWTTFERWNNTTETEWTDTKVYAGTRYQYGVKAYPLSHDSHDGIIGGPMDPYNLGMVGPLKTTVRITTRTLKSVTAGTKQMTVKWTPSKNFTGYQIKYATDASFTKNVGAVKVESATASSKTVTGLKTGTTYYVTVRSYHVFNGMTYFGEWSNVLSCTVK